MLSAPQENCIWKERCTQMRILLAEDETEIAKGLKYLLEKNRFAVDIV